MALTDVDRQTLIKATQDHQRRLGIRPARLAEVHSLLAVKDDPLVIVSLLVDGTDNIEPLTVPINVALSPTRLAATALSQCGVLLKSSSPASWRQQLADRIHFVQPTHEVLA